MKVLVIGGNRFFGRRLVELLLAAGDDITLLNRGRHPDPFGDRVRRIPCDRKDEAALVGAARNDSWDAVVDQVAYDAHDARVAVRAFAGRTPLYLFTSTNSVYAHGAPDLPEAAFDPYSYELTTIADSVREYGEAKRQAEALFFRETRWRVIAARFPIVCGPDDYTGRLRFHVERVQAQLPIHFPNLQARMTFIHAADAAASLAFLLKEAPADFHGPVNCASPDAISMAELVRWIESAVGREALIAEFASDENRSPFANAVDSFTSTRLLKSLGFEARPIRSWLPPLLREIA
jgi:nucleoside-diphosphate-sugar epimerase